MLLSHRVLVKNLIKVAGTQDVTLPWFKGMSRESITLKIKIPHFASYYIRWFCNGVGMKQNFFMGDFLKNLRSLYYTNRGCVSIIKWTQNFDFLSKPCTVRPVLYGTRS